MKTIKLTEESGFSLLEMLMAMTIMAIGLLGIALLQLSAIQGSANSIKMSQATSHITERFENLKTLPLSQIQAMTSPTKTTVGDCAHSLCYSITTTVTPGPVAGTAAVRVDAEWTDKTKWTDKTGTQKSHKIGYSTIFANPPAVTAAANP